MEGKSWTLKKQFLNFKNYLPPKGSLGQIQFSEGIDTFTQFDPLQFVVFGNIDNTTRLMPISIQFKFMENVTPQIDILPEAVVETARKQQEAIVEELQKKNIKVVRVGYVDHSLEFDSNGINTKGYTNFNARDLVFTFGDSLYEFPTPCHCRQRQIKNFEWIEQKLAKNSKIYSAPKTIIDGILYEKEENAQIYNTDIVFGEAANLLKFGTDILFLISQSASWGCYKEFRRMIEEKYNKRVRVHPLKRFYTGIHVDSNISPIGWNKKLGKFLVLVNANNLNPKNIPALFRGKNWAVIQVHQCIDEKPGYQQFCISSLFIGMNLLVLNPQLVLISDKQTRLHEILNLYGIQCLKMPHTYGRHVGGAFHCMSNDLKRKDCYGFKEILTAENVPKEKLAGFFDAQLLEMLEKQGDLENWVDICNNKGIYPNYVTDHLTQEEKLKMERMHKQYI